MEAFERVINDFQQLYGASAEILACDEHPDYLSTRFAHRQGEPVIAVQHHLSHILACLADNGIEEPALGVAWDGTGYGPDGTIWGGEFLLVNPRPTAGSGPRYHRFAHLRTLPLAGGDQAVREPRRAALGVLFEIFGAEAFQMLHLPPLKSFPAPELKLLRSALESGVNAPRTSSAGRLFDAVAALLNLRQINRFEGQAAMELEFAQEEADDRGLYPFNIASPSAGADFSAATGDRPLQPRVVDWSPTFQHILADLESRTPAGIIARRFHNTLAAIIVRVAEVAGQPRVALSGGCFQNRTLLECSVLGLEKAGFMVCWHQRIPPGDGGIALGQV
jgi:hydrogenase maturation protein HypF